jgi:dienelactone hydrolase
MATAAQAPQTSQETRKARTAGADVAPESAPEAAGARDPRFSAADVDTRRERLYRQWEQYLLREARDTYAARERNWPWDLSNVAAYERSLAGPRRRWRALLGGWPRQRPPLAPRVELLATEEATGGRYRLERVWFTALPGVEVDALLLTPPAPPVNGARTARAAVLVQHGLSGTPEEVVGVIPGAEANAYRRIGIRLAERGFIVFAPHMVGGFGRPEFGQTYVAALAGKAQGRARTQLNRIAIEYGRTLMGLEMLMLARAVDFLAARPDVDAGRIGMFGLSQGGQSALWFPALDTRIAATVVSGYFNQRFGKQLIPSERYTAYLGTEEEDKFLMGRLQFGGDAELASLVCPRPLFVEHGKKDGIGWWEYVQEEFGRVQTIYERLGIGERAAIGLHEAGHIADGEESLPFLERWLSPQQGPPTGAG